MAPSHLFPSQLVTSHFGAPPAKGSPSTLLTVQYKTFASVLVPQISLLVLVDQYWSVLATPRLLPEPRIGEVQLPPPGTSLSGPVTEPVLLTLTTKRGSAHQFQTSCVERAVVEVVRRVVRRRVLCGYVCVCAVVDFLGSFTNVQC